MSVKKVDNSVSAVPAPLPQAARYEEADLIMAKAKVFDDSGAVDRATTVLKQSVERVRTIQEYLGHL